MAKTGRQLLTGQKSRHFANGERPGRLVVSMSTCFCAIIKPCAGAYSSSGFRCAGIEKPYFSHFFEETLP